MKSNIKVDINIAKVMRRVGANKERAQKVLDSTVLKDCSRFVPFQTGNLEGSGIRGTVIGSGLIVYSAPYARYQYYGISSSAKTQTSRFITYSKNKHPEATRLWFEAAKKVCLAKWAGIVQKIMVGGNGNTSN